MDPALLLEALTKNGSLPGVEEMVQRESQVSCLHSQIAILPLIFIIIIQRHTPRIIICREGMQMQNSYILVCTYACLITLIFGEEPWLA